MMPEISVHIFHLLQEFHGSLVDGHSGVQKTYRRILVELYWKGMHRDVRRWWPDVRYARGAII